MKSKKVFGIITLLAIALLIITSVIPAKAADPVISTDKADYFPGETVTIYGTGFDPNGELVVTVERPDGHIDSSEDTGTDIVYKVTVVSWAEGDFTSTYQLDGIEGIYTVTATDGTNVATTTFTDAPAKAVITQVRNGPASSPVDPGNWVTGNVGDQQGHYIEGNSIPYRCVMENLPVDETIMISLEYDIRHSSRNAIDYLTYYDRIDNPDHNDVWGHDAETINPLIGVSGVTGPTTYYTIPAPSGSPQPSTSYAELVTDEGPDAVKMTLFGGTITNIQYWVQGDLTAAQSATSINVTFTVGSATEVLAWGGHIASREDWGYTGDVPNSAGGISGSPYHMRTLEWHLIPVPEDSNDDLKNLGNQDLSLSAAAVYVPPATVTVIKDAVPNDAEDFYYTGTLADPFYLDDDADATLPNSQTFTIAGEDAGTYTVIEGAETWWDLDSIVITGDTDGGSSVDLATRTATIDVDPGEEITITFTNQLIPENLKQFTYAGAMDGFTEPIISADGKSSTVFELNSGPQIWWQVTYYFENTADFLGDDYDGYGHNFILWDKWGGNLLVLGSQPQSFDTAINRLEVDGVYFFIDYDGYSNYLGTNGLDISGNTANGAAWITLHMGDKQQGTNPGKGHGSGKDGKSYDADIRWEIGWLEDGQSAMLHVWVTPGMNPAGKLEFTKADCYFINTGPRVRVYEAGSYEDDDFLYSISYSNQLEVCIEPDLVVDSIPIGTVAISLCLIAFETFAVNPKRSLKRKKQGK